MNFRYPIEALLRPPVELYTAVSATGAAIIAGMAPWALMMTPSVGTATALLCSLIALRRYREGFKSCVTNAIYVNYRRIVSPWIKSR